MWVEFLLCTSVTFLSSLIWHIYDHSKENITKNYIPKNSMSPLSLIWGHSPVPLCFLTGMWCITDSLVYQITSLAEFCEILEHWIFQLWNIFIDVSNRAPHLCCHSPPENPIILLASQWSHFSFFSLRSPKSTKYSVASTEHHNLAVDFFNYTTLKLCLNNYTICRLPFPP